MPLARSHDPYSNHRRAESAPEPEQADETPVAATEEPDPNPDLPVEENAPERQDETPKRRKRRKQASGDDLEASLAALDEENQERA